MKKSLLTLTAIIISIAGFGQSGKSVLTKTRMQAKHPSQVSITETSTTPVQNQSSQSRKSGNNQTSSVCGVPILGNGPNAFGTAGGSRAQLSYDQDLDAVVFVH